MSVIQFRRGTAAGNPVLAVGEPGYKTSTGEFKVGDGTTAWNSLPVFATTTNITAAVNAAVSGLVNGAPGALDTLKELADALGDDANFAATVTSALAAKAPLASPTFTGTVAGITKTMVGLGNNDNTSDAAKPVSTAQQAALLGLVQAAKNPDMLVTGAVTVDGSDLITSAAVVWPDGSPGTLTITSRDANNAVLAYNITYGSPVTKTYTQPAITRNTNGAATNVPAIVVT